MCLLGYMFLRTTRNELMPELYLAPQCCKMLHAAVAYTLLSYNIKTVKYNECFKEYLGHEIVPAPCLVSQCCSRLQTEVADMLLSYEHHNIISVLKSKSEMNICLHHVVVVVVFVYFTDMCIIHLYIDFIIIFFLEHPAHLGLIYPFKYKFSH